ncbi:hypothetical protein BS50DRAFT_573687 [Corynespora cassiicola Philippines]|uniref:Uncharacterized protein n=1 Tax=Corynespora cassiicola Philippines TaxID=1448308 RepID=A0A2T2NNE0_CORCC|nr:hypothetical protein BS50DRAFT_573687 [Corynespora cassiicola Philippines]
MATTTSTCRVASAHETPSSCLLVDRRQNYVHPASGFRARLLVVCPRYEEAVDGRRSTDDG